MREGTMEDGEENSQTYPALSRDFSDSNASVFSGRRATHSGNRRNQLLRTTGGGAVKKKEEMYKISIVQQHVRS